MTHHPPHRTATALLGAGLLLVGGVCVATAASAAAMPAPADADGLPSPSTSAPMTTPPIIEDPVGCHAELTATSRWPGGFVASVRVTNLSMFYATDAWVVTVDLPGAQVRHSWNATPAGTSPETFTPAPWSRPVGLTGSTEFGFVASGSPDASTVTCAWPDLAG